MVDATDVAVVGGAVVGVAVVGVAVAGGVESTEFVVAFVVAFVDGGAVTTAAVVIGDTPSTWGELSLCTCGSPEKSTMSRTDRSGTIAKAHAPGRTARVRGGVLSLTCPSSHPHERAAAMPAPDIVRTGAATMPAWSAHGRRLLSPRAGRGMLGDMDEPLVLPAPCIVVLVGPSGAGKTTWAHDNIGAAHTVSSDALRLLVGDGEDDLVASADAFELLEIAIERRARRRLTTVIDTLGMDADRRARWRALGKLYGLPVVCVAFDVPTDACRARNRERDKRLPAQVLTDQARRYRALRTGLDFEGFDLVVRAVDTPIRVAPAALAATAPLAAVQRARPVRLAFGLQVPAFTWPGGPSEIGPRLRAIARAAEEAGFESLWLMDHLRQIPMFGPAWHDMLESWTALAHLSAATERIRLGTLVTGVTYRNVAQLAKIVATLDVLSGGRAECGLGAAWFKAEHDAYGLPFPAVRDRYALLEDALRLLPVMWGPGSKPFEGKVIRVPETMCYPRPLQEHVPITVGGNGERQTLRLAATLADACNIIGDVDVVAHKVAVLHQHADAAGRDRDAVRITQLSTTLVGRDGTEVERLVASHRPARIASAQWSARVNAGTVTDQVGRFRALADAGVQTAIVSLPDLAGVEPIERFRGVIDAFGA